MVYAIGQINNSTDILPNVTLGFIIYDSCYNEVKSLIGTTWILSGKKEIVPNFNCHKQVMPSAIVGDIPSKASIPIARILGLFRYPQVSYASSHPLLSDKIQFPSFLRTVSNDIYEVFAIARLVNYFNWTWVGVITSDNDLGRLRSQMLTKEIELNGGCIAFIEILPIYTSMEAVFHTLDVIKKSSATVIIVYPTMENLIPLMEIASLQKITGKVWIGSSSWSISSDFPRKEILTTLNGSLSIMPHSGKIPGLKEFLYSIHPSKFLDDIFIKTFWQEAFRCFWPTDDRHNFTSVKPYKEGTKLCTGKERPDTIDPSVYDVYNFRYTYKTHTAVFAIAHALHQMNSCIPGRGPFSNGSCANIYNHQPWQLLHYIKNVKFNNTAGETIFFDENGDVPLYMDILNWQLFPNGSSQYIVTGSFDASSPKGQELQLDQNRILWNSGQIKAPLSVCSAPCPSNHRRAIHKAQKMCCFDCIPCSEGEILNPSDDSECLTCPNDKWPNIEKDMCVPKPIEFLSYEEFLGFALACISVILCLLTFSVLCLFIMKHKTPIVKANNRELSYLLLVSLMLCFLCTLLFIGRPTITTCMLRQVVFGIIFSICVSVILAKTITVIMVFNATNPESKIKKLVGLRIPMYIVPSCTMVQIILCIIWLLNSSPFVELNMTAEVGIIVLECNEGSKVLFSCVLGYTGLLASISLLVAFMARKLPDTFNEAKFIAFSMLVFASVWVTFVPSYLSTKGKLMVAVEVFAILSSGAGLLVCIFFPKCYIILILPEMNSKKFITGFHIRYYRFLLAMIYAITQINNSTDVLPNITLGFQIYDSCYNELRSLIGTTWLLSGKTNPVPNFNCHKQIMPSAIIGDATSKASIPIARILGLYRFPQVSFGATHPLLSNKMQFPSFLRTISSDINEVFAIAQLVKFFNWTWVGVIASDNDLGRVRSQMLTKEIELNGGCVEFIEILPTYTSMESVLLTLDVIKKSTVTVIVVYATIENLVLLMEEASIHNITDKVWISSSFFISSDFPRKENLATLNGSLSVMPQSGKIPGLKEFLYSIQPSMFLDDIFIKTFWQEAFGCVWPTDDLYNNTTLTPYGEVTSLCTGKESPDTIDPSVYDVYNFRYTYKTHIAVFAVAHALHQMYSCLPGHGPFKNGSCADIYNHQPWQLLHYLKKVNFVNTDGESIYFDDNGDVPLYLEILNWQLFPNGSSQYVLIGSYDARSSKGHELHIDESRILWNGGQSQAPLSICSTPCARNHRRATRQGQKICCFDCIPCSEGEILNPSDDSECFKCPEDKWPDSKKEMCAPKLIKFLSYEEMLGYSLACIAIILCLLTTSVLCLFIIKHKTPIVKANNRELSYLLLISLMFCFLCSLIFIGHPTMTTCMLRQVVFGIIFCICLSSILAKTITVIMIFNATNPDSKIKKLVELRIPIYIVPFCTMIQIILCIIWLSSSPPFVEFNMAVETGTIIIECNEGSKVLFSCVLGYMSLLASISLLVAFLARKLPDTFNEAKFITFSMLVFASVWITFIPAYLSTKGRLMVAVEVFAILSSSTGLLACIFFPKCYIILLHPEMNSKIFIRGRNINKNDSL
ncbi:uncharacterized protein O3C94_011907 [Discoglossus pictus]